MAHQTSNGNKMHKYERVEFEFIVAETCSLEIDSVMQCSQGHCWVDPHFILLDPEPVER
jgi:hypothetical protein